MTIEYIEILSTERELIGIIDNAKSIIWHDVYYGVGDFEIYAPCTPESVSLLVVGNYVTRYDDDNIGIIESANITYNAQNGRMIVASGRFAKSLLDRRIIYTLSGHSVSPTILRGNVEDAARKLVTQNAINCTFDSGRNIAELALGTDAGIDKIIVDSSGAAADKQVTHDNLLTYSDSLLEEYGLAAKCVLNDALKLAYTVYSGTDRSADNAAGNQPVIFSQDFDNLISSAYLYDETALKNTALIGGAGEGEERFHAIVKHLTVTGAARREVFVDASSSSRTYKDENGEEQTLTDAEYNAQLETVGMQAVSGFAITETFDGEVDLINGSFQYRQDFNLGDIVTVQDAEIGLYINVRILEVTEVEDDAGYMISIVYGK